MKASLIAVAGIIILAITFTIGMNIGYNLNRPYPNTKQPDSTEYAVYTARPVNYPEDCEPVYIPMELLGICQPRDTVYIDTATNILALAPLRDAETHKPALFYQRVVIQYRLEHNKRFPLKH